MRLNLMRILSYLFLIMIVLGVFSFRDIVADKLLEKPKGQIESVEIENTLISLNKLYEEHLINQLNELEHQRLSLEQQFRDTESIDINSELLNQLQQLQDEKVRLEGEIDYVQHEAGTFETETEPLKESEEMYKQLASTRQKLDEMTAEYRRLESEFEVLSSALGYKEGEANAFRAETARLSTELADLKRALNNSFETNTILQNDKSMILNELQLKSEFLKVQEIERLEKETEYERQIGEIQAELQLVKAELADFNTADEKYEKADEFQNELMLIIEKLFNASDIRGVFITTAAGELQMIINHELIQTVVDSSFVSVYRKDGTEISKIIISATNDGFDYRVFPGYPEPEEGNWF